MADNLDKSKLLSPSDVVGIAWALTGFFATKDIETTEIAAEAKKGLDYLKELAKNAGEQENLYVIKATGSLNAAMRTLNTIYKGRVLNIEENDNLRKENLENIKQGLQFGNNAKDIMKSLPTMAIASGTGTITLTQLMQSWNLPDWAPWLIGLGTAGIGYFINLGFVRWGARQRQGVFIKQDYERDMFYQHYLTRVRTALINLYNDIARIHESIFQKHYPVGSSENAASVVDGILKGNQMTMCEFVHKHFDSRIITPNLWVLCETGGKAAETCKYWEK